VNPRGKYEAQGFAAEVESARFCCRG
jgi:hypothetical protein